MTRREAMARLRAWFTQRGWSPLPFQQTMWRHYLAGESGLLHTPTGSGKTLAMFGGPLLQGLMDLPTRAGELPTVPKAAKRARKPVPVMRVLWITPLRALAADTARALREPLAGLGLDWQVGLRTGDASARDKRLAKEGRVDVLVTTPESLALLLSYPDTMSHLRQLRCIVVDEWHELLGNKRGVLLQLNLQRLRDALPALQVWGLSATLGNLQQARQVLLPDQPDAPLVGGARPRPVQVETLLPPQGERFPWAGHLGLGQLQRVQQKLFAVGTSLLFTNTRAQAELWHQALSAVWPETTDTLALHHGSLDPALRRAVEQGLREGRLRCVVATSSLDLGVDFPAVDQVLQIGSPKGIARLVQRAGRARHRPGESGHIVCVPTHALEVAEYAAARSALANGVIEARRPLLLCLDVLAQHCVSCALGGGFHAGTLLAQVRRTHAFAALDEVHWQGVLDFIVQGGQALAQYPDFHKVVRDDDGVYRVHDRRVALRHRLSIGTISSDSSVQVQYLRGGRLGAVEEQFIGRLRPGDRFQFSGRLLELVRLEQLTAYVRLARGGDGVVPRWQGGRLPLSEALGEQIEALLAAPPHAPEMRWLSPLLQLQDRVSALPGPQRLLVEVVRRREGQFVFVHPFAGRQVHEGMAALMALRWTRQRANTVSYAATDHGFVLAPAVPVVADADMLRQALQPDGLLEDLHASLNLGELARRQFRDIARISGLLIPALPGRTPRSLRQLQASAGLLYDVLREHDPGHILLGLAEREVLTAQLDVATLQHTLQHCQARTLDLHHPATLGPLSFPLWAERLRGQVSNEDWKTRVRRAAEQLEGRHER